MNEQSESPKTFVLQAALDSAASRTLPRLIQEKLTTNPGCRTGILVHYEIRCQLAEALDRLKNQDPKLYRLAWILLEDPSLVSDEAEYRFERRGFDSLNMWMHLALAVLGMQTEIASKRDLDDTAKLKAYFLDEIIPSTWPEEFLG